MKLQVFTTPHQRAAYQRSVGLLIEAHEILANVKSVNWTQAHLLNEVFQRLEHAAESLIDVSAGDLPNAMKHAISEWSR